MGGYEVEFSHRAAKQFSNLEHDLQRRVAPRIEGLRLDPRPSGVEKLESMKDAWRLRVGDYRIVFTVTMRTGW